MEAAVLLLSAVVVVLTIVCIVQSKQIRQISRRLSFLRDNASNMRLTYDSPFPSVNRLVTVINEILEKCRSAENLSSMHENELKSTIISLSHDIRTPLTSLDGYFQLLTASGNEVEKQQYIAVIRSRIAALKDILEELFTYTKLNDSGYELPVERLELTGIVGDSLLMFYEELNSQNISPTVNISDEQIFVQGNAEALHRIFHNIIKHAVANGSGEKGGLSVFADKKEEYV
ncbi:MAG: sensor histidine kinase, partial [Lachnospiraceae bacterium]|nr:sensor histidine kinase [Lachnospiraceae bacterium]